MITTGICCIFVCLFVYCFERGKIKKCTKGFVYTVKRAERRIFSLSEICQKEEFFFFLFPFYSHKNFILWELNKLMNPNNNYLELTSYIYVFYVLLAYLSFTVIA